MSKLDNLSYLGQLDKSNMLSSIGLLPRQIESAWAEVSALKIPASYKKINKVVINGMGGSGLGTHIVRSLYFKELKLPLGNIHSYELPGIVDKNTLYILSSYSGGTEEVLATYLAARKRGAKILAIASGGELGALIKTKEIPGYLFTPTHNPCGQPRIGLGYSVIGILGLLNKCGVIKIKTEDLNSSLKLLDKLTENFSAQNPLSKNLAKQVAADLQGKIPVIIAAEFLSGNAHALANQLNENAKNFSAYFLISELNHHLLEGLAYPKTNQKNLHFVFLASALYHSRNKKRFSITQEILEQQKINYSVFNAPGNTPIEQSFASLLFGSYVSFYLAMLNGLDPSPIPFVDYFKEKLNN
jgi:glucose/mannose-6-phosphate isomerase